MPNSTPDLDSVSSNETAESNTNSRTDLSDERLKPKADPFVGTPEADLLNVSGSGPRSTDVEPGADPKIKEGKLRMTDKQTANLETGVLTPGPQDLPGKDPSSAEAKAEVEPVSEENKPEVIHEAESSDEVSDSRSEIEKTSLSPKSKEESINASEHEPQCAVQDSLEDIPSLFPLVAFRSSTPIEAMTATEADCESPLLIENEETKAGREQNY